MYLFPVSFKRSKVISKEGWPGMCDQSQNKVSYDVTKLRYFIVVVPSFRTVSNIKFEYNNGVITVNRYFLNI